MKQRMSEYEAKVRSAYEAESADITNTLKDVDSSWIIDHENEDKEFFAEFTRVIDDVTLPHAEDKEKDAIKITPELEPDQYLGMKLALPRGDDRTMTHACMTKRIKNDEGNPVGTASNNPLLDSRAY